MVEKTIEISGARGPSRGDCSAPQGEDEARGTEPAVYTGKPSTVQTERPQPNRSQFTLKKIISIKQPEDLKITMYKGAWVAQPVNHLTSAQVMISQLMSSSPTWGSVLTARSLEPASDSVSPSLSAPLPLVLCLSLTKINKCKKNFFKWCQKYEIRR